jgi:phage recombination protein Bet
MASRYSVEPTKLLETLKATVFQGANNEELMALVVVANEHRLNPFTREIYAFPKKGGGIQAVVSIDGWIRLMNEHPKFDGVEFMYSDADGDLACTAVIHVKDRKIPVSVTEYKSECERNTDPWKTCPKRMLRHKALIQCARVAFGFGLTDEDDVPRNVEPAPEMRNVTPAPMPGADTVTLHIPKPEIVCPQRSLSDRLTEAGISFDDFKKWATKHQPGIAAETLPGYDHLESADAKRLLRAVDGIIAQIKEGGKQ